MPRFPFAVFLTFLTIGLVNAGTIVDLRNLEPFETELVVLAQDARSFAEETRLALEDKRQVDPDLDDEPAEIAMLVNRQSVEIDGDGRKTIESWRVFVPLTTAGVESWDAACATWWPWREDAPSFEIRVLSPDGSVLELDPADVADQTIGSSGSDVYSDRTRRCAPIPGIEVDAVIEQRIVSVEREALHSTGTNDFFVSAFGEPTRLNELRIGVAETTPLVWKTVGLEPDHVVDESVDGHRRVWLSFLESEDSLEWENDLGPEVHRWSRVSYSTVDDWASAAAGYAEILDGVLEGYDAMELVAELPKELDRRSAAEAILDVIAASIRYTGLELGEAAVVPQRPDTVLSRRFGDCKDLALMVVAAMRELGHPAEVALLRAGFGEDIDPEMAGLDRFNHAIVFLPGEPGIWIDATAPFSAVGILPASSTNRWALIATSETEGLVKTSELDLEHHFERVVRVLELSDGGDTAITEETLSSGWQELSYRSSYIDLNESEMTEFLSAYAEEAFGEVDMVSAEISDARDRQTPFSIRFSCKRPEEADAEGKISVDLFPDLLADQLPSAIFEDEIEKREQDLWLPSPKNLAWSTKLVPPPGFELEAVPEGFSVELGPGVFTSTFELTEDGALLSEMAFDLGSRRWTPAEGRAAADGLDELNSLLPTTVRFGHRGIRLIREGAWIEGVAELSSAVEANPASIRQRDRLATALLDIGMVDAARTEAEAMTEIDPEDYLGWYRLGLILQHDAVGRFRADGWDRQGSKEALARAVELAGEGIDLPLLDFIILHELNDEGLQFVDQELCSEAAALHLEHAELVEQYPGLATNRVQVMRCAKLWDEMERALEIEGVTDKPAFELILRVEQSGIDETLTWADQGIADSVTRRDALILLAQDLSSQRRYEDSVTIYEKVAAIAGDQGPLVSSRQRQMAQIRVWDPESVNTADPKQMLGLALGSSAEEDVAAALKRVASVSMIEAVEIDDIESEFSVEGDRPAGTDRKVFRDIVLGLTEMMVEGNAEEGWTVHLMGPEGAVAARFIDEDGEARLLGTALTTAGFGQFALDQFDAGRVELARRELNWLRRRQESFRGDDPLLIDNFSVLWPRGGSDDPARLQAAAASLLSGSLQSDRALKVLDEVRKDLQDSSELLVAVDLARVFALESKEDQVPSRIALEELVGRYPESAIGRIFLARKLVMENEIDRAEKLFLEVHQDDPGGDAAEGLVTVYILGKRYEELRELLETNHSLTIAARGNDLAWLDVVLGKVDESSLEQANRAAQSDGKPDVIHTLATVFAELDRPSEAYRTLRTVVEERGEVEHVDFYVLGRIAETYGLVGPAQAYYEMVEAPGDERIESFTTYGLAQRQLASLQESAQE